MSNPDSPNLSAFGKFVPGFDFLQSLATQASGQAAQKTSTFPSLGSWVAPTLNVEELDKRIQELKAVQFWLDQNAAALKATIQALEVQKMTLATLKGMNFNMAELAKAFTVKSGMAAPTSETPEPPKAAQFAGMPVPPAQEEAASSEAHPENGSAATSSGAAETGRTSAGLVDPMQWWSALTQQFQGIAADAMRDAAKNAATVKSSGAAPGSVSAASDGDKGPGAGHRRAKAAVVKSTAAKARSLRSSDAWPLPVAQKAAAAKPAAGAKPRAPAKNGRKSAR